MIFPMIFIAATTLVLICGVLLMARGGKMNKKYGNKLMVARVVMQTLAILCIGLIYYFKHHAG